MDNFKKMVGTRINSALALRNIKQKELAKAVGVTDNTISYFANGARTPNTEQIVKIAEYLDVSTDYLLGKVDEPSTDPNIQMIGNYTGLSELAILNLRLIGERRFGSNYKKIFSDFIASEFFTGVVLSIAEFFAITEYLDKSLSEYIDFLKESIDSQEVDANNSDAILRGVKNSVMVRDLPKNKETRTLAYFQAGEYIRRFIDAKTAEKIKGEQEKIQTAETLWPQYSITEKGQAWDSVYPIRDYSDFDLCERTISILQGEYPHVYDPETE